MALLLGSNSMGLNRIRRANSSKARCCSGPDVVASFLRSRSGRDSMSVRSYSSGFSNLVHSRPNISRNRLSPGFLFWPPESETLFQAPNFHCHSPMCEEVRWYVAVGFVHDLVVINASVAQQVRLALRKGKQGRPLPAYQNGSPSHSLSLDVCKI